MSGKGVFYALIFREVAWFRRFIGDYVTIWLLPTLYGVGVIFLPSIMGGLDFVLERMSHVFNRELTLTDALAFSLSLSGIITIVAVNVGDILQTLYAEFKLYGSSLMILESTSIPSYVIITSLVRPVIMTLMSTLYLVPTLILILRGNGILLYLYLLTPLLACSVILGLLSGILGSAIVFYTNVRRPWSVSNIVVPALLAGSGIYIPLKLVPFLLRFFALFTPVPYTVELIQSLLLQGLSHDFLGLLGVITGLFTIYYVLSIWVHKTAELKVRGG
ncbi:MAG: hypothetical protein QXP68_04340 [Thermosphaera sp.]